MSSEIQRNAAIQAANSGLRAGLAGLAGLVIGSDSVESLLTEVATYTVLAVPGADGAGLTMLDSGQSDTIVASATFVRDVDDIQYRLGEGPCISAAGVGRTVGSGELGQDGRWPGFGPKAAALDIHSALSLPLIVDGDILGALNVYSHAHNAFDGSAPRAGERFAASAAVAVHNVRAFDQAQRHVLRLEAALTSRATIDQALGIMMARSGASADEAFVRLRIMSQHQHLKLTVVAEAIVGEAVRRARARQSDDK